MEIVAEVRTSDRSGPLSRLLQLPLGLDIWEAKRDRIVLRAEEAQIDRLSKMGYQVRAVVDVQAHLRTFLTAAAVEGYHSAQSLEHDLRELAASRPEIAELNEIGRSIEGRPIWALRIGVVRKDDQRRRIPKVLFMGCHHAREWIAVEVPFLLARELVQKADDPRIANWLSNGDIWVTPMVNPDGHEYSRTSDRLWRKNRRKNWDGSFGVDPNRNYGYMWGILDVPTSSHVPSDETYVGPRAFSEPETQAIRDLVAVEKFVGVVTYHSYSQLILLPWGYTKEEIRHGVDRETMQGLAGRMSERIRAVHGRTYVPQQSSRLYPTAGDTTDWTYGTYGIPSFTVELRPAELDQGGFILPPDQIAHTFEENREAAFHLIDQLIGGSSSTG